MSRGDENVYAQDEMGTIVGAAGMMQREVKREGYEEESDFAVG